MTNKLTDAIDELVQQKTFSLDALDAVKRLKDQAAAQELKLEQINQQIAERNTRIAAMTADLALRDNQIKEWKSREDAIVEREKKMQAIEVASACAQTKAQTLTDVFGTIFRNTTVREHVVSNTGQWVTQPGGYPNLMQNQDQKTYERTSE